MAEIVVSETGTTRGEPSFRVEVHDGPGVTTHDVTVPAGLPARLGWRGGNEELVRVSFEFLLEREPATSILRRFSLEVIGGYFPEYPSEMGRRRVDGGA